jgi:eukaryotic-like serine/threonine-protein kinase
MDPLKSADPGQIGDIQLHGRLGQGGMGMVFFGVTVEGDRVAVKMIREELAGNPDVRARFEREIVALRMVQGPRVAGLVDTSEPEAARPWLAVEYVRGLTLRDYVQAAGPLPAEMGAALGILLAEGLAEIHRAGLLHRDLKPANILLGRDGPKVIDFGLAALADGTAELTASTDMIGTPACMPPEQVSSPRDLTAAADVYALGAALLFALTGHYPYTRPTLPALLHAIMDPAVVPDLAGLPPSLAPISAMLDHDPASRPGVHTVDSSLRDVLAAVGLPVRAARIRLAELTYTERTADPPADIEPPRPPRRRPLREPRAPDDVVAVLAEKLRRDYARAAPF